MLGRASKQVYFAQPRIGTLPKSVSLLIILFCCVLAFVLSFFLRETSVKPAAPAIFLLAVISVAHFSGRLASLLVAMVGGLSFAAFLFEPYGSLAVYSAADRIVLLMFAVAAVGVVCLSGNSDTSPARGRRAITSHVQNNRAVAALQVRRH